MYRVKSAHEQLIYNSIALKWDLTSQLDVALWQQLLASRPNLGVSLLPPRFNEIIHELGGGRSWRRWYEEEKRGRRTTMRKGVGVSHHPSRVRPHWSPSVAERWSFNHSRPMIVAISARCRPLGPIYPLIVSARPGQKKKKKKSLLRSLFGCVNSSATIFAVTLWPAGRISTRLLTFSVSKILYTHRLVSSRRQGRQFSFVWFIRQRTFGFIIPEEEVGEPKLFSSVVIFE